jgi:hypothetical protein
VEKTNIWAPLAYQIRFLRNLLSILQATAEMILPDMKSLSAFE